MSDKMVKIVVGDMDYKKILEESYTQARRIFECPPGSRYEYLAVHLFGFTTYDPAKDELFGRKAVEVCRAISSRKTHDYTADEDNYLWYLMLCNTVFFSDKLDWGTAIRGAWWDIRPDKPIKIQSCGLWEGGDQISEIIFDDLNKWRNFIKAVIDFADKEKAG